MPERHHPLIAAALSIALLLFGRMLGDLLLKPLLILLPKARQDMAFLLMYLKFIGVLLLYACNSVHMCTECRAVSYNESFFLMVIHDPFVDSCVGPGCFTTVSV